MTVITEEIKKEETGEKEILPLTNDAVFRMYFASEQNIEQLRLFLKAMLPDLTEEDLVDIQIKSEKLTKADVTNKDFILDLRLVDAAGHYINVEMQMKGHPYFIERAVSYNARNLSGQLKAGDDYTKIKASISLIVTSFRLFEDAENYYEYVTYRRDNGQVFTDVQQYHIIDLTKLPEALTEDHHVWGALFKAKTDEELRKIMSVSEEMKQAGEKLRKLSEDELAREYARAREESEWAYHLTMTGYKEMGLAEGLKEGRKEGANEKAMEMAQRSIKAGIEIDLIVELTGLTEQEIEGLKEDLIVT